MDSYLFRLNEGDTCPFFNLHLTFVISILPVSSLFICAYYNLKVHLFQFIC